MNFKADWSFLQKISMGAVASRAVVDKLNSCGHEVIELERYSTSNKIWSTKIKRLRLPDLICLKCGKRIESRAKSKLDVRMSDNENNPDRRWDAGLRDEDMIAFIKCTDQNGEWIPASDVNYFETGSMRASVGKSKLGPAKSAGEGAERDRVWPTTIPKKDGVVTDIIHKVDKIQIKMSYDDGSKYTYSLSKQKGLNVYCSVGDRVIANETMIAGAPTFRASMDTCSGNYDFLSDLDSERQEVRYAGVKALGYLAPEPKTIKKLYELLKNEYDQRIKLEIYSSLIRLGEDLWDEFENYALSLDDAMYHLEYCLILGELKTISCANAAMMRIMLDTSLDSELRAAAVWGVDVNSSTIQALIETASDDDDNVASHAIAHVADLLNSESIELLIDMISNDEIGGIVLKIITSAECIDREKLIAVYKNVDNTIKSKWCALIIGLLGDYVFKDYIADIRDVDERKHVAIEMLWDYSKNAVNAYREGAIDFLLKQTI